MRLSTIAVFTTCAVALGADAVAARWDPIDPTALKSSAPLVQQDADAEFLLWEVQIEDSAIDDRSIWTHHVIVKVFTARGRDLFATVDIDYPSSDRVEEVAGRTVKADGRAVELAPDAIFERTKVKAGRRGLKSKSFALPDVQPGDVVEYRWVARKPISHYKRVHFQQDVPVRLARCRVLPLPDAGLRSRAFNMQATPFRKDRSFFTTVAENLPAFRQEPFMPPADQVRGLLLLFYSDEYNLQPDRYWRSLGRRLYAEVSLRTDPNDEVRRTAAALTAGAATPEEKLASLYDFCRTQIKNAYHDASGFTDEGREKLKPNNSAGDTLKRRVGTGPDILMLFAALARASGFDARMARVSDREDYFFDPAFPDDYFLSAWDVAVKLDGGWRFYDPASPYLPIGMLRWPEEGTPALVTDAEDPVFVSTPISGPDRSRRLRSAELQLAEDGTLEGEVRIEYTGQIAAAARNELDHLSLSEREAWVKAAYAARLSSAEITSIALPDPPDFAKPFVFTHRVRVPGFAQRTGRRLFLQPSFFETGNPVPFTAAQRSYQVYFSYPFSEQDRISIRLPEGYELDAAQTPAPVRAAQLSSCELKMGYRRADRTLLVERRFVFGEGGTILFPASTYPGLKQLFDDYHAMDAHTVTLLAGEPRPAASR